MKLEELASAIAPYAEVLAKLLKDVQTNAPEKIKQSLAELKVDSQTIEAVVTLLKSHEGDRLLTHLEQLEQQSIKAVSSVLQEKFEETQIHQKAAATVEPIMTSSSIRVSIHIDEDDNTIFLTPTGKSGNKETARIEPRSSGIQDRHVSSITLLKHALLNRLEPNMPLADAYKNVLDTLDILLPMHLRQDLTVMDKQGSLHRTPYYEKPAMVQDFYDTYKPAVTPSESPPPVMSKAKLETMMEKLIEIYDSRVYLSMKGKKTQAELTEERKLTKAAIETLCTFEWQLRTGVDYFDTGKSQQQREQSLAKARENAGILWNLGYKQGQIDNIAPLKELTENDKNLLREAIKDTFDYPPLTDLETKEISESKQPADNERSRYESDERLFEVAAAHLALISVLAPKLYELYHEEMVKQFLKTVAKQHKIDYGKLYTEVYDKKLVSHYQLGFSEFSSDDYKIAQNEYSEYLKELKSSLKGNEQTDSKEPSEEDDPSYGKISAKEQERLKNEIEKTEQRYAEIEAMAQKQPANALKQLTKLNQEMQNLINQTANKNVQVVDLETAIAELDKQPSNTSSSHATPSVVTSTKRGHSYLDHVSPAKNWQAVTGKTKDAQTSSQPSKRHKAGAVSSSSSSSIPAPATTTDSPPSSDSDDEKSSFSPGH
jgi:hypothetical protein